MYRPLWRGIAVIYSSDAGRTPAEVVAKAAAETFDAPAHVYRYRQLDEIWGCYDAYIFVTALPAAVRALCPRLETKEKDPPTLAVTHDLKYAIPLIGAHRGANHIAQKLAETLGAHPVISTVAEATGHAPLEDVEWLLTCHIDPRQKLEIYKAMVKGHPICIDEDVTPPPGYHKGSHCPVVIKRGCAKDICCTPWKLYAGFGATSKATPQDIAQAIQHALKQLNRDQVEAVASIKPIVHQVAKILQTKAIQLTPQDLKNAPCTSPPSKKAQETVGLPNVAELAALAAAGPNAQLIYRKKTHQNKVTVAIAATTTQTTH